VARGDAEAAGDRSVGEAEVCLQEFEAVEELTSQSGQRIAKGGGIRGYKGGRGGRI
jgi:hypothetical protein